MRGNKIFKKSKQLRRIFKAQSYLRTAQLLFLLISPIFDQTAVIPYQLSQQTMERVTMSKPLNESPPEELNY
jgi:hypothetical protein